MGVKLSEIEKLLNNKIKEDFGLLGYKKKGYDFVKEMGDFSLSISFATYNYGEKWISFSMSYGSCKVAKINFLSTSDQNDMVDLSLVQRGVQLNFSTGSLNQYDIFPWCDFVVAEDGKAEDALIGYEQFKDYYINQFIPYTEKANTIELIEEEYNEGFHFKLYEKYSYNYWQMLDSIVLAKFVSEERFQKIKNRHQKIVNTWADQESWNKVIKYLEENSLDELLNMIENKSEKNGFNTKNINTLMQESVDGEINGFDSDGEPEIIMNDDKSINIIFNFMPPLNGQEDPSENKIFDEFDAYLSSVLSVEVIWEDREVFHIPHPKESTKKDLIELLNNFWKNQK